MAHVQADPEQLQEFRDKLRQYTDELEEVLCNLRTALEATDSWQDSKKEECSEALEEIEHGVRGYLEYSRDELDSWLSTKITQLEDYNG